MASSATYNRVNIIVLANLNIVCESRFSSPTSHIVSYRPTVIICLVGENLLTKISILVPRVEMARDMSALLQPLVLCSCTSFLSYFHYVTQPSNAQVGHTAYYDRYVKYEYLHMGFLLGDSHNKQPYAHSYISCDS